jgi:predicted ATPase
VPEYKAGVFWVGLAALRDPALVLESIAQTLGAKDDLAGHIGERELLLLLDNLEQVIDDAAELSDLLRACPKLRLLVTSRELLRIDGEVEYGVPSRRDRGGRVVLRTRTDGRHGRDRRALHAPRQPAQILERLSQRLDLLKGGRDADLRQQTLRATIAWSYDLLPPEERELFERLSVFASGCSCSAAEIVAEGNVDTLQSLIDKSLVRRRDTAGGQRYLQLETIRQYAAETLDDHQESSALRDRHLDWIVDHVTANAPVWVRPADPARVGALFEEEREILAAIAWAVTRPDADRALELCGRMGRAWVETGRWGSGLSVTLAALSLCTGDPELVARAQLTAGVLGSHGGSPGGDEQIRTARELFNDHGLAWEAAVAGMILGSRSTVNGNVDTGIALLEQSVAELAGADGLTRPRSSRGLVEGSSSGSHWRRHFFRSACLLRKPRGPPVQYWGDAEQGLRGSSLRRGKHAGAAEDPRRLRLGSDKPRSRVMSPTSPRRPRPRHRSGMGLVLPPAGWTATD